MYTHFPSTFSTISPDEISRATTPYFPPSGLKSGRRSFVLSSPEIQTGYDVSHIDWSLVPTAQLIRGYLEMKYSVAIRYCLVHLYPNGKATINWHNDKEALDTYIFSVSFGAERRFRLRQMSDHTVTEEFRLGSGDLFVMAPGCQRIYEHTVPQMKCNDWRINFTLRT
jgi:hypothetical protein